MSPINALTIPGDTSKGADHTSLASGPCAADFGQVGSGANDAIYAITPTRSGVYNVTLQSTTFDAIFYVTAECGATIQTCVSVAEAHQNMPSPTLGASLEAGKTYYIVVDGIAVPGAAKTAGSYTLSIKSSAVAFNMKGVLTHDTIANIVNLQLDPMQDAMDDSDPNAPTCVGTASAASFVMGVGLPDDAHFNADQNHPALQLSWNNESNDANSHILSSNGDSMFSFAVTPDHYKQIQMYGTSTAGNAAITLKLHYMEDSAEDSVAVQVSDWAAVAPGQGEFVLAPGLSRASLNQGGGVTGKSPVGPVSIYGQNVIVPQPDKTLVSVDVVLPAAPGSLRYTFYGAIGW
jgi:hypothetical protein